MFLYFCIWWEVLLYFCIWWEIFLYFCIWWEIFLYFFTWWEIFLYFYIWWKFYGKQVCTRFVNVLISMYLSNFLHVFFLVFICNSCTSVNKIKMKFDQDIEIGLSFCLCCWNKVPVESTNFEMCRYTVTSVSSLSSENSAGSVSSLYRGATSMYDGMFANILWWRNCSVKGQCWAPERREDLGDSFNQMLLSNFRF